MLKATYLLAIIAMAYTQAVELPATALPPAVAPTPDLTVTFQPPLPLYCNGLPVGLESLPTEPSPYVLVVNDQSIAQASSLLSSVGSAIIAIAKDYRPSGRRADLAFPVSMLSALLSRDQLTTLSGQSGFTSLVSSVECANTPAYAWAQPLNTFAPNSWPVATPVSTFAPTDGSQQNSSDSDCVDISDGCPIWHAIGQCEILPEYMRVNCPQSCNFCTPANATADNSTVTVVPANETTVTPANETSTASAADDTSSAPVVASTSDTATADQTANASVASTSDVTAAPIAMTTNPSVASTELVLPAVPAVTDAPTLPESDAPTTEPTIAPTQGAAAVPATTALPTADPTVGPTAPAQTGAPTGAALPTEVRTSSPTSAAKPTPGTAPAGASAGTALKAVTGPVGAAAFASVSLHLLVTAALGACAYLL